MKDDGIYVKPAFVRCLKCGHTFKTRQVWPKTCPKCGYEPPMDGGKWEWLDCNTCEKCKGCCGGKCK